MDPSYGLSIRLITHIKWFLAIFSVEIICRIFRLINDNLDVHALEERISMLARFCTLHCRINLHSRLHSSSSIQHYSIIHNVPEDSKQIWKQLHYIVHSLLWTPQQL